MGAKCFGCSKNKIIVAEFNKPNITGDILSKKKELTTPKLETELITEKKTLVEIQTIPIKNEHKDSQQKSEKDFLTIKTKTNESSTNNCYTAPITKLDMKLTTNKTLDWVDVDKYYNIVNDLTKKKKEEEIIKITSEKTLIDVSKYIGMIDNIDKKKKKVSLFK